MLRLKIIHQLRTAVFLLVASTIAGGAGLLWWANSTGMPESWRNAIERNIAKHDIHIEIGALSLHPLQGIIAREVRVYADASRQQVISRLEGVILDLDNAKLAKGQFQLAQIKLSNAKLSLPVDPDRSDSEVIEITGIEGTFIPPGNRKMEIRNATGNLGGIEITINASILDDLSETRPSETRLSSEGERHLIDKFIRELRNWRFDPEAPPEVHVMIEGARSQPDQLVADISLKATSVEKNQHRLERLQGHARLQRNLLTVTSLEADDGRRQLSAHLDYNLTDKSGRFDIQSGLEIPELLQAWLGIRMPGDLVIAGDQDLQAAGMFDLSDRQSPDVHVTGKAKCNSAMLRGIRFDQMKSSFAWRNGDIFLKDLELVRPDGKVQGKVMIQDSLVRMDLNSSLLPHYYRPLFIGKPMEELIADFTSGGNSRFELELEGGFDLKDPRSWAYTGSANMENMQYRGVALAGAQTRLALSSAGLGFSDGNIEFDYANYPLALRFDGPDQGRLSFESIHYQRAGGREVRFEGLAGNFWPAPLCRMFLTRTADHLEAYQFHHPPGITGSGTIGLDAPENTRIELKFESKHAADYVLLGSVVTVGKPAALVTIAREGTTLEDFRFEVFEGKAIGAMHFPRGKPMSIDVDYSKLSMDSISENYKLKLECGGRTSGKLKFEMMPGKVASMQGKGNFSLIGAELFSVPMFGPLSSMMQVVLNDKRAGAERAKNAVCSYRIQNGILATSDFQTSTTSLVFVGVGSVDLNDMTMDMTMRVNARGLLGILFLPLKPFAGMFQFHGSGPLKDTTWKRVSFTDPDAKLKQLLEAPRRNVPDQE